MPGSFATEGMLLRLQKIDRYLIFNAQSTMEVMSLAEDNFVSVNSERAFLSQ